MQTIRRGFILPSAALTLGPRRIRGYEKLDRALGYALDEHGEPPNSTTCAASARSCCDEQV
jgi:hypothetical protein